MENNMWGEGAVAQSLNFAYCGWKIKSHSMFDVLLLLVAFPVLLDVIALFMVVGDLEKWTNAQLDIRGIAYVGPCEGERCLDGPQTTQRRWAQCLSIIPNKNCRSPSRWAT